MKSRTPRYPFDPRIAVTAVAALFGTALGVTTAAPSVWAAQSPAAPGSAPGGAGSSTSQSSGSTGTTPGTASGPAGTTPGGPAGAPANTTPANAAPANGATTNSGATAPGGMSGQNTAATAPAAPGEQSVPAADGAVSPDFDLARTIRAAIAASAQIQIQAKQVQIDDRRIDETEAARRPNVSGNGRATHYDAPTAIAFGGQKVVFQKQDEQQLSLNLTEELDLLGNVQAARNQDRLQQAADRATLQATTQARALQAKTLYFGLLRAQHQVQVAHAALNDAVTQEAIARRLYENQVGQKIDLLRAETNTAQAQQNLTAAENNLDNARSAFNDLVGRSLDAPVVAQDVPGVSVGTDIVPTGAVGSAATENLPTFTPFHVAPTEVNGIDINGSIAQAQTRRPEVVQNAALARAAEIGVRIAREGMYPTFAVAAEGDYYPTTDFAFPRQKKASITISASVPLYDGGRTRDLVKEAHLRTDQARTALASAKEDVALAVRQAYANLQTAARQIDTANTALTQAIAARQLAQIRYEGQVGLFLEVTDAQAALVQAENAQVAAVYNYLIARAQFENALGVPALQQTNSVTVGVPPAGAVLSTGATAAGVPATTTTTTTTTTPAVPAPPPATTGAPAASPR